MSKLRNDLIRLAYRKPHLRKHIIPLVTARFSEGEPADPTENMSPEDAEKWEEMNEEYGDKFRKDD